EDGIRDFHVTGVQTCALPISLPPPSATTALPPPAGTQAIKRYHSRRKPPYQAVPPPVRPTSDQRSLASALQTLMNQAGATRQRRSEERRVGKEGSNRGPQ